MFQLILGISLGLVLLFVILLLVTEVAATYPVWRQFDGGLSSQGTPQNGGKQERNTLKILLLVMAGIGLLATLIFMLSYHPPGNEAAAVATDVQASPVQTKLLTATLSGGPLHFRLHTKWEDGKLYGNNRINIAGDSAWAFAECRYFLLDKDGFLVKEMAFAPEDFVTELAPDGRVVGYMNRFNADMSLREYQKIEKLQVVIDKKFLRLSFTSQTPLTGLPVRLRDRGLG